MGSGYALDFEARISSSPLTREQQIILQRQLLSVGDKTREGRRVVKPLHWHLVNVEAMMKDLRDLRTDLINAENQSRLDVGNL
jgi:hypothetical protein